MRHLAVAFATLVLFVTPLSAASFAPLTDDQLIDRADAVVRGTIASSTTRVASDGLVRTDFTLRVESAAKGSLAAGTEVTITEVGGVHGNRFTLIPGSATYAPGERVVAFLRSDGHGTYFTASMALGKFRVVRSTSGAEVLERDRSSEDVQEATGDEPVRLAAEFLAYVRDRAKGLHTAAAYDAPSRVADALQPQTDAAASAYCVKVKDQANVDAPARWPGCESSCSQIQIYWNGTQGTLDSSGAVTRAASAWTSDPNSFIPLKNAGSTSINAPAGDGFNVVVFNTTMASPQPTFCDGTEACSIISGNGDHNFRSELFHSIADFDVLIRPTVTSQSKLDTLLTHEIGHGIGFRHSDAGTPSSSAAIMATTTSSSYGANLQAWDKEAVATVYGNGLPCVAPTVTGTSGGGSVTSGGTALLTVTATGSTPLSYQWYEGQSGDSSAPISGATSSSYRTPSITSSKSYWVAVSNTCGTASSATINVTPAACTAPSITVQPQAQTIASGGSATFTVGASGSQPFTYEWYQGLTGDTSRLVGSGGTFTTPALTQTTQYWVRVRNSCGFADSSAATATVPGTCAVPTLSGPSQISFKTGQTGTLSVAATGQEPFSYQWYEGGSGDTSRPVNGATTAQLKVGPFATPGSYNFWVKVTNACGTTNSVTGVANVACGIPPIPEISAPQAAESTIGYRVTWINTVDNAFELQESTNPEFSNPLTIPVNGATNFAVSARPNLLQDTAFYYRVRAIASCDASLKSEFSIPTKLVHRAVRPNDTYFAGTSGMTATMTRNFTIPGIGATGKTAMADSYSAVTDQPWLTVVPSSGSLPPEGATVQIRVDGSQLGDGTTMGTIVFNRTQGSGKTAFGATPVTVPVTVSLVTPVTSQPRSGPAANSLIIPAVAHATGQGNSQFQSDVRLTNTSAGSMTYQLTFTPTRTDGTQNSLSTLLTVAAGETKAINDIVRDWYGKGFFNENALGTVEIRPQGTSSPSSSRVTVAASRTYNVASTGTFGQFIPAIPFGSFIGSLTSNSNARLSLQQIASSAAYRTNVGFVEGSGEGATVTAKLFDKNGAVVAERQFGLQPYEHIQENMSSFFLLGSRELTDARMEVTVASDRGKVSAYASVLDNKTSDPLLVFPVQPASVSASRYVMPGVAELVRSESNFHTDMRLYNASSSPAQVTLTYSPLPNSPAAPGPVTITLQPQEVRSIDNALPTLWNLAGGGAIVATTPNDASVIITGRTYSRQDDGGTYGQFIPAVNAKEATGAGEDALEVVQLEESNAFRSNLGLFEVTGNSVQVELSAYRPESKVASKTQVTLAPNQFLQFNRIFTQFGLSTVYNGRVSVKVIGGSGRVSAYGSVVDNRTLDPTYVPAQ